MKIPSSYHIWIMLALGFTIRLIVYFNTGDSDAGALRTWAMVCDLAIGYVIYWLIPKSDYVAEGSKKGRQPLLLVALWLFNPAVIYVSSALGFIEPLILLLTAFVLLQLRSKIYSAALILVLPVLFQLRNLFDSTNYGTLGAFNFFGLLGGIERPLSTTFLGFSYTMWGAVLVLAIVAAAAYALYTDYQSGSRNYFFIAGAYFLLLSLFATGMEVRSLFPGLIFLLIHYVERRDTPVLVLYLAFSVTFLINAVSVQGWNPGYYIGPFRDSIIFASTANMFLAMVLAVKLVNSVWPEFKWMAPPGQTRQGIPVRHYIWILLAGGFLIRVLALMHIDFRFPFDIALFKNWGIFLYEHGFAAFYGNPDFPMTDYPPVYLYVLYLLGALRARFGWEHFETVFLFFTFLPAILCDLGIGYVLYRRGVKTQREHSRPRIPVFLAALWILSPAVILISSLWGQVESVFSMVLLFSLLLLRDRKLLPAYLIFGVAILTKPQSLFLGPVYLYSAIEYLQEKKFSLGGIWRLGAYIMAAVALMVLLFVPFNLFTALESFFGGLGARPYGSINAFNFFSLIGGNFRSMDTRFMGLTYGFMGTVIVIVLVVGTIAALSTDRKRGGRHYFFIVGALFALIYVFSFRMLDRYLFPALPFLLLHAIESRDRRALGLYAGFSATFFYNCYEMLRWVRHNEVREEVWRAVSVSNVLLGCVLLYVLISGVWGKSEVAEKGEILRPGDGSETMDELKMIDEPEMIDGSVQVDDIDDSVQTDDSEYAGDSVLADTIEQSDTTEDADISARCVNTK